MDDIVRLAFGVLLMLLTLYVAAGFLAVPLTILRRTGAIGVVRWCYRTALRGLVGLFRFVALRRRRRVRRPLAGAFIRLFK